MSRLTNHPGWRKGMIVRLATGQTVEVVEDGRYVCGDYSGLWHYRVRYPDGREAMWIPCIGDRPIGLREEVCGQCSGAGHFHGTVPHPDGMVTCPRCDGSGRKQP